MSFRFQKSHACTCPFHFFVYSCKWGLFATWVFLYSLCHIGICMFKAGFQCVFFLLSFLFLMSWWLDESFGNVAFSSQWTFYPYHLCFAILLEQPWDDCIKLHSNKKKYIESRWMGGHIDMLLLSIITFSQHFSIVLSIYVIEQP